MKINKYYWFKGSKFVIEITSVSDDGKNLFTREHKWGYNHKDTYKSWERAEYFLNDEGYTPIPASQYAKYGITDTVEYIVNDEPTIESITQDVTDLLKQDMHDLDELKVHLPNVPTAVIASIVNKLVENGTINRVEKDLPYYDGSDLTRTGYQIVEPDYTVKVFKEVTRTSGTVLQVHTTKATIHNSRVNALQRVSEIIHKLELNGYVQGLNEYSKDTDQHHITLKNRINKRVLHITVEPLSD